jgi:hypothetical protein
MLGLIRCRRRRDSFPSLGRIVLKMGNDDSFEPAQEDERISHDYEPP